MKGGNDMNVGVIIWLVRAGLVVSCSALGIAFGGVYTKRVSLLTALAHAMAHIRTRVMQAQPLSGALAESGEGILERAGVLMKGDVTLAVESAFHMSVNELSLLPLAEGDIAVLSHYLSLIAQASREEQASLFDEACASIEAQIAQAKTEREKNTQLCRTMGCLGGLALMLLTL